MSKANVVGQTVQCSFCSKDLLGHVVGLFDQEHMLDWDDSDFGVFRVKHVSGRVDNYLLLHHTCFDGLMAEMQKLELTTILTLVIGSMEDIREGILM